MTPSQRRAACAALGIFLLIISIRPAPAYACGCCDVKDPTGTPLNLRDKPNGKIIGTVANGTDIERGELAKDSQGRYWMLIEVFDADGNTVKWGWVFRKYLDCHQ